jgi:hypothetical protein
MLWTDKAHTQMPCGTGVAQKSRHRFDGLKPPSTNWLYVPCRPIVGTKSRSGESGLWHRCSTEVSTPLRRTGGHQALFGYTQPAGQSRARSREPGESALWHRCSHVELSVHIHPPSGLKADWGRPPRGQCWYANQPDSGGVRACTPTYVKRSDLQKLDTHEHRRTHCLNLGVKWSQVQILSARPHNSRSLTCGPH